MFPLEQLIASPELPRFLQVLNNWYQQETERRALFHKEVTWTTKAEFINGEFFLQSPPSQEHKRTLERLHTLLATWLQQHPGGALFLNNPLVSLTRNDYKPDLAYYAPDLARKFIAGQQLFPAPTFVCEIVAMGTERHDRGTKFEDYAAHRVREYWIIDPERKLLEQYLLQKSALRLAAKLESGPVSVASLSGCSLPVEALFEESPHLQTLRSWMRD